MSVAKACQRDKSSDRRPASTHIQQCGGRGRELGIVYVSARGIDGCCTLSAVVSPCRNAGPRHPPDAKFISQGGFLVVRRDKTPAVNDTHIHTIPVSVFYLQAAKKKKNNFMKQKQIFPDASLSFLPAQEENSGGIQATTLRHQNTSREIKIQQTCFVEWKCPICVLHPAAHSIKLKPRAASVAIGAAGRRAPSSSSCFVWPRQSKPMMHMMRSSAGDATLARFPFSLNSEMRSQTRLSEEVAATDGARARRCVWSRSWVAVPVRRRLIQPLFTQKKERNGSVFMLTHNDWFHWAPRIITKGFPLLNGNYKRQIDSKQLTSWVKQLSPQCSCGWWCRQE